MTIQGGRGFPVDLTVSRGAHNRIRISAAGEGDDSWSQSMTIRGAAEIVRVLRGWSENEYFGVQGLPGADPLGFRRFERDGDPDGSGYELYDRSGNTKGRTLCTFNEADAVALELALERAIIDSVYSTECEVWMLLSTAVLTGDAAVDGADQVGTRAFAFSSREAACDHLREFMRPDVNDSRPEGAWDGTETVDDVLDSIFEGNDDLDSDGDGMWTYDGSVRSYEWKLVRLGVRT